VGGVTLDQVDAVVEVLDRLLRRIGDEAAEARRWQLADHGRAALEAHLELQAPELRAAFTHLVDVLPTLEHRRAWASARTWLRAGRRISQTTPSLPYVVQLAIDARSQLDELIGATAPGTLHDRLEAARSAIAKIAEALYPPRSPG
jgi:hypothetical protein